MTSALRALAGEGLRHWLLRMTSSPLRGVLTGAGITAIVQSSTAVTVMTIGFVGAGLISITQSLGVIYGANIGTTMTGWLVNLVGMKLKLGVLALPALFLAAMVGLLARGRLAKAARMLAGLSLIFIGLETMQTALTGLHDLIPADFLPGESWGGRLALVGLGLLIAALLHSSSAGVAILLVLLGAGTISLGQAVAMMVGMHIGTTLTGVLASLAGGRAMLRAALANLLFNLGTATVAFPVLGLLPPLMTGPLAGADAPTALVLFHTLFAVSGTLLFLPLTRPFGDLLFRVVPDRPITLAAALDRQLLSEPGTAIDAAAQTARAISRAIGLALQAGLAPDAARDDRMLDSLPDKVEPALAALETWLSGIHLTADQAAEMERMAALMHLTDHLTRLIGRAKERDRIAHLAEDRRLVRPARAVSAALARPGRQDQALRLATRIRGFALRHRRGALLREHAEMISPVDVFKETDALRWLDRVAEHAERIAHYGAIAAGG